MFDGGLCKIARWVEERWAVCYTASGMAAVLRRLGYVYKRGKEHPIKSTTGRRHLNINGAIDIYRGVGQYGPIIY